MGRSPAKFHFRFGLYNLLQPVFCFFVGHFEKNWNASSSRTEGPRAIKLSTIIVVEDLYRWWRHRATPTFGFRFMSVWTNLAKVEYLANRLQLINILFTVRWSITEHTNCAAKVRTKAPPTGNMPPNRYVFDAVLMFYKQLGLFQKTRRDRTRSPLLNDDVIWPSRLPVSGIEKFEFFWINSICFATVCSRLVTLTALDVPWQRLPNAPCATVMKPPKRQICTIDQNFTWPLCNLNSVYRISPKSLTWRRINLRYDAENLKKIVFVKKSQGQIKNFVGVALCAFDLLPE